MRKININDLYSSKDTWQDTIKSKAQKDGIGITLYSQSSMKSSPAPVVFVYINIDRKEFCQKFGIPLRTMEEWETGRRIPPEYIPRMLAYYTRSIDTDNARNEIRNHYDIVEDAEGNKVVIINDLRFKSRRNIDWNTVEQCLKEYVGSCVQILETSDEIYIGKDFPDEYTHSKDTKSLKGANRHAKANASQIVEPMIKIAAGKTFAPNYEEKHVADAKYGWYRYDTRFAIPVYNDEGNLCRYNIFGARILIRHDEDGKMYLYDILRIKKETSEPLEQ